MNTEFSNHIRLQLLNSSRQDPIDLMADPFVFQPIPQEDDGGLVYLCDHTFTVDSPTESELREFGFPRSCLVQLFTTDGRQLTIGTQRIPARVILSRHLQRSKLKVECRMKQSPL